MLNKRGEVKILDFGLAKLVQVLPPVSPSAGGDQRATLTASQSESLFGASLSITKSGALLGTPLYMAPECWRSEPAIAQSDVYSLGALLFELCVGRTPHHAESAVQLGFTVLGSDAPPLASVVPSVDARFAAVIDRCLQRDATKRYASGVEVRDALERIVARAVTLSRRVLLIGSALLFLVIIVGVGLAIARDRQAKRQAELARHMGQEISAMEWLLRTARQSPLHDLDREKVIIRARMKEFATQLESYGTSSRGLAHYALGRGHMALTDLEPTVRQSPHFLWGINDLGLVYLVLGVHLQLHGHPAAKETFERAMQRFTEAGSLDPTYTNAPLNSLPVLTFLTLEARADDEILQILAQADGLLAKSKVLNSQSQQVFNNYFQIYARAAYSALLAGQDPRPRLQRALEYLAETRNAGGVLLDAEQNAALAHRVDAAYRVQRKEDPTFSLNALQDDLKRCFGLAAQDATCRTFAAQGEWVRAEWLTVQGLPSNAALVKAKLATESPETHPDAWQTLAETSLRLGRATVKKPAVASQHVSDGLTAVTRVFAINANHALARLTQGSLYLLRAQLSADANTRRSAARAAVDSLEQALKQAPFLIATNSPLLREAQSLARSF